MKLKYHVVVEKNGMGYSVHCPELRGCWSQGHTKKEALENIEDAIQIYLDSFKEILRKKEVHELEIIR